MVDSSDWAFHQATQTAIGKNYALKIRIDPVTLSFSIYRKIFFQFMFYWNFLIFAYFAIFLYIDCCYEDAHWIILEPIMLVEVNVPQEFQGSCLSLITNRDGVIQGMYEFFFLCFDGKNEYFFFSNSCFHGERTYFFFIIRYGSWRWLGYCHCWMSSQ